MNSKRGIEILKGFAYNVLKSGDKETKKDCSNCYYNDFERTEQPCFYCKHNSVDNWRAK